jgi:hypothetical protein
LKCMAKGNSRSNCYKCFRTREEAERLNGFWLQLRFG